MQAPTEQLRSDLRPCLDLRSRSAVLPTNGCSLDSPRLAWFTSLGRGHASHHQRSHWSYPYMGFMRSALVSSTGAGSPRSRSRATRAFLQERMEGYGCGLWRLWPTEFRGTDRVGGSANRFVANKASTIHTGGSNAHIGQLVPGFPWCSPGCHKIKT